MRHTITVHMKLPEYEAFMEGFRNTLYKIKSDYARKLLLGHPVTVVYRNRSLDDLFEMGVGLREELQRLSSMETFSVSEKEELSKRMVSFQEKLIQLIELCSHTSSRK